MNNKNSVVVDDNGEITVKKPTLNIGEIDYSGWWHSIKTFLSFFALVSAFAWIFPTGLPIDEGLVCTMLICGAVSALLSCIVDIFKITHLVAGKVTGVLTAISAFTFIPFVPIIVAIVSYVGIFAMSLFLCAFFPYVATLITYFVKLIRAKKYGVVIENKKKEIITAAAGVLCAVAVLVVCFIIHGSVVATAPLLKDELNTQQLYNEYISKYPEQIVAGMDFANPTSSEFDADTLSQNDIYEFETTVSGVTYKNTVTVRYTYRDGEWGLYSITEQKNLDNSTIDISGTFEGTGQFKGTLSIRDFKYIFVIDKLTKDGGSASLTIYDEKLNENLTAGKCNITVIETVTEENDIILNLNIVFNEQLAGGIKEVSGKYSVASGELTTYGFAFAEEIVLSSK